MELTVVDNQAALLALLVLLAVALCLAVIQLRKRGGK